MYISSWEGMLHYMWPKHDGYEVTQADENYAEGHSQPWPTTTNDDYHILGSINIGTVVGIAVRQIKLLRG